MPVCTLTCRTCGDVYDLSAGESHRPCPACGTENCRPQREADVGDALRRATKQRLRCDFTHAENSYQYVLQDSPDEHEALWGLVQCRYAVEYVRDPHTGNPTPIVHAVQQQPMLTDPDFREACELAPEAVREQYRREAMYIDDAMAKILALAEKGESYDVFLCHKTTRTDGVEGYTEDFKRATDLYIMLRDMGHRVFFAPFAGLTPGESYEAGIYHALSTAKVMLVICSNAEHITSPWVRTEWQRFLRMSYEPQADKHLIPLLYEGFPPRRLPDDFRRLQAIAMGELDATEKLMAAVGRFVGRSVAKPQPVQPTPALAPVGEGLAPSRPARPAPAYVPLSPFKISAVEGGVAITGYNGPGGEMQIPETIGGQPVLEIGMGAFRKQKKLTKIVIPAGVKSIGADAFYGCSGLTGVSLPVNLTDIGNYAFWECSSLTGVTIPEGVKSIGENAFSGCGGLTSVSLPAGLTSIGSAAFSGCSSLTNVSLPESVTSIGKGAFSGCSGLTRMIIPAGVTSVGQGVFERCSGLKSVSIPVGVASIGERAFYGCRGLVSMDIPAGVTSIGEYAFSGCTGLKSVSIPKSVTSIRFSAFNGCSSLTSVSIPKSMTSIGSSAFNGCSGLTSMSIPESVTSIGSSAFYSCSGLTSVSIPGSVTSIGSSAFNGCSGLTSVSIPGSVKRIGDYAFSDCRNLTSVSIPGTVKSIGNKAFDSCPNLTLRVHPNTPGHTYAQQNKLRFELIAPTSQPVRPAPAPAPAPQPVGEGLVPSRTASQPTPAYAPVDDFFKTKEVEGGVSITKYTGPGGIVRIPAVIGGKNVVEIGTCAFADCRGITSVSFPESMMAIGLQAFFGCSKLESVSFPEGLNLIAGQAFGNCSSLTRVNLPKSLTGLGSNPFMKCSALQKITVAAGNKKYYVDNNVLLTRDHELVCYPAGLKATHYVVPDGVTKIESSAFSCCDGLEKVSIPEGVWSIGSYAFQYCRNLLSVEIPRSVTNIEASAFQNCEALTIYSHANSYAHGFALQQGIRFKTISLFSRLFGKK